MDASLAEVYAQRLVPYLDPYEFCLMRLIRLLDVLVNAAETHETFHWESGMRTKAVSRPHHLALTHRPMTEPPPSYPVRSIDHLANHSVTPSDAGESDGEDRDSVHRRP